MERSILIIAHNEADRIGECLSALARQTVTPDEIVLVAHNCTDDTAKVARSEGKRLGLRNLRVDEWKTEGIGPVFPRIRAFDLASNEVCACIDGDSVAEPDWLEKVTAPLANPGVSGVGGTVRFFGDLFGNLASLWFFDIGKFRPRFHFYFWGANFACKKSAYRKMGGLEPFISIRYRLGLHFWAEDCYLSLALERVGKIIYQSDAAVCAYPGTAPNTIDRGWKQEADRKALFRFFSETASALDF